MIEGLIDKQDNFELVRDQIAAILVAEVASQMALATDAGKDPNEWKLRIFTERSNPWEQFTNNPADTSPLVNVWYDNSGFDPSASNTFERQKADGVFNIDCYGYGESKDVVAGGHTPGDQEAAFEVQRALRLVRNILMAAEYAYLGLRGLVWSKWPQSIKVFQPQMDLTPPAQQIVGARIAFRVSFNEFSPQVVPEILEYVANTIRRTEDGEIVLEADYNYLDVLIDRVKNGVPDEFVCGEMFGIDSIERLTNSVVTFSKGAELSTGGLTVGEHYVITARTTADFVADGAPDNNVGTVFEATGSTATLDSDNKVKDIPALSQVSLGDTISLNGFGNQYGADAPRNWVAITGSPTIVGDTVGFLNEAASVRVSSYFDVQFYRITVQVNNYIGVGEIRLPYDGGTKSLIATENGMFLGSKKIGNLGDIVSYTYIPVVSDSAWMRSFAGHTADVIVHSIVPEIYIDGTTGLIQSIIGATAILYKKNLTDVSNEIGAGSGCKNEIAQWSVPDFVGSKISTGHQVVLNPGFEDITLGVDVFGGGGSCVTDFFKGRIDPGGNITYDSGQSEYDVDGGQSELVYIFALELNTTSGQCFTTALEIKNYLSGSVFVTCGFGAVGDGVSGSVAGNGVHEVITVCTGNPGSVLIGFSSDFNGSVTNFTMQDVTLDNWSISALSATDYVKIENSQVKLVMGSVLGIFLYQLFENNFYSAFYDAGGIVGSPEVYLNTPTIMDSDQKQYYGEMDTIFGAGIAFFSSTEGSEVVLDKVYVNEVTDKSIWLSGLQTAPVELWQNIGSSVGLKYQTTYTVGSWLSGNTVIDIGGADGTLRNADGTYVEDIISDVAQNLTLKISVTAEMELTNIKAEEYT